MAAGLPGGQPRAEHVEVSTCSTCWRIPAIRLVYPNRLHADYGGWGDGHPNGTGAAAATAVFATDPDNFLDAAWEAFAGESPPVGAGRIGPAADLVYLGAFRLPGASGGSSWEWGGRGVGHHPGGDPGGEADGFPGSLYGIGHDHLGYVSEISIPVPVISPTKNFADLAVATTLQSFANARAFNPNGEGEWIMGDLAVLPPQGTQTTAQAAPVLDPPCAERKKACSSAGANWI
jgi:hypothetical protein